MSMPMSKVTLRFGGLLVGLGVGAYAVALRRTGAEASKTALIPAAYGALFLGLGALARGTSARRPVVSTAAALAGLGGVGLSAMVLSKVNKARGGASINSRAMAVQATTALLSLGYAALGARRLSSGALTA